MLFSRVYNWIKYKTLPPSVLFLNRFYVERDSKHRRVTSNLGLTFRNSKWSSYARTNINLSSKTTYLATALRVVASVAVVLAVLYAVKYYGFTALPSPLYSLIWFLFDADLYLKAAVVSALLCSTQLAISAAYNRALAAVFGRTTVTVPTPHEVENSLTLPQRLHKPVLYKWLTTAAPESTTAAPLFSLDQTEAKVSAPLPFFKKLYTTLYTLEACKMNLPLLSRALNLSNKRSYASPLLNDAPDHLRLIALEYLVLGSAPSAHSGQASRFSHWTLDSIHAELTSQGPSLKSIEGAFYLSSLQYSKLSTLSSQLSESAAFKTSIDDQLALIRWQRWLYKYNLMHRSLLTATTQISTAKSLMSSGFYTSTLSVRNIWAASVFSKNSAATNSVRDNYELLYGDIFTGSRLLQPNLCLGSSPFASPDASRLGFYEPSFHWFTQRFYQLNTLPTNHAVLTPRTVTSASISPSVRAGTHSNSCVGYDLQAYSLLALPKSSLDVYGHAGSLASVSPNTYNSDPYLSYYDYGLFTKSRAESITSLSSSRSTRSTYFFSPSRVR